MITPKHLSLFSGGGGGDVGFHRAGFQTVAFAEIDTHASAVLRYRHPGVPNLGDVVALSGGRKMKQWLRERFMDIDLVHSSSPCQDLSVAGKRAGMKGLRSSLYFRSVRIFKILGCHHFLWENVPGALSSHKGDDFALVLSALVGGSVAVPRQGKRPKWPNAGVVAGPDGVAAWRILDLQHFGPPQRRRRLFVFCARAGGVDPAEVLLESAGVRGDSSAGCGAGKGAPTRTGARAGAAGRDSSRDLHTIDAFAESYGFNWQNGGGYGAANDGLAITPNGVRPLDKSTVKAVVAFTQRGREGGRAVESQEDLAYCLTGKGDGGRAQENNVVAFDTTQVTHPENRSNPQPGDPCHPLAAGAHPPMIVPTHVATREERIAAVARDQAAYERQVASRESFPRQEYDTPMEGAMVFKPSHFTPGKDGAPSEITPPLSHDADKGDQDLLVFDNDDAYDNADDVDPPQAPTLNGHQRQQVDGATVPTMGVPRRLMPVECEKLMGWSPGYTEYGIDLKGKVVKLSDAARYRICGNGIGGPMTHWIGLRFKALLEDVGNGR